MTEVMRPKILLVDDEQSILDSLYRFCRQRKWDAFRANGGAEGLELLATETVDIIISDMRMPNMDGAEFLSKSRGVAPNAIRILLTGYADMEAVISAVNDAKIYNYLNKPWDDNMLESVVNSALDFKQKEDQRLRLLSEVAEKNEELINLNGSLEEKVTQRTEKLELAMLDVQQSNKKISKNFRDALTLITSVIEMQDGSKANHTEMVANASVDIAKALDLSPKEVEQIRIAAGMHNIGKFSLPEAIRKKPMNELNPTELELFRTHTIQGEAVLSGMTGLKAVSKLVRSHQEYLNGKGYPDKLKEDEIPIGAKIICVTSDFQKLESNLLRKEISGPEEAVDYLKKMVGVNYDARIVDLFEKHYESRLKGYRSYLSQLSLSEIKEGMILAENLLSSGGLSLLTKDTVLTAEHISQFTNYEAGISSRLIFPILNSSIDDLQEQIMSTPE
jgi:response regulator RpfG family c-di-GMP phosphodiesterase